MGDEFSDVNFESTDIYGIDEISKDTSIDFSSDMSDVIPEDSFSDFSEILDKTASTEIFDLPEDYMESLDVASNIDSENFTTEIPEDISLESYSEDSEECLPEVAFMDIPEDIELLQEENHSESQLDMLGEDQDSYDFSSDESYGITDNIPEDRHDGSFDNNSDGITQEDTVDTYHATPNSEIPILQEDGTIDTLENIINANNESENVFVETESYCVSSNSEIPISQEDGSLDLLETIMPTNADVERTALYDNAFEETLSDIVDGRDSSSLEAIMEEHTNSASSEIAGSYLGDIPVVDISDTTYGNLESADEDSNNLIDDSANVGNFGDSICDPIFMAQSDVERYIENDNNPERLRQMRDEIASGRILIDDDTNPASDDAIKEYTAPILVRDHNEQWEVGNNAIDNTVEAMRDDLRDKGMEDGYEMEAIVMAERARMQDELTRSINGNPPDSYQERGFTELLQNRTDDVSGKEISDVGQLVENSDIGDNIPDVPEDIDYDAIYSGLDSYDFDGIDVCADITRLDSSLYNFQDGTWEALSLDEQKAAMSNLANYVEDVIGFDNPPDIVYYNNPVEGDYGGYSPSTNTLSVNEYMLYDNNEAADTVAHELWHAYQHERAANPQSAKDYQYQYGFDNYIRPDEDFTAYQDQLVEAEARAFAQQFKDRLKTKGRSI